jgi:hypothetical protein
MKNVFKKGEEAQEVKVAKIELTPELVAGIARYLATKPISEVNHLFNALTAEADPQFKILQEAKTAEEKV